MKPTVTTLIQEEVASEDVEGDENSSHHFFGINKELFEHTQAKSKDGNLHHYLQEQTVEVSLSSGSVAPAANPTSTQELSEPRTLNLRPVMGHPDNTKPGKFQPMLDRF